MNRTENEGADYSTVKLIPDRIDRTLYFVLQQESRRAYGRAVSRVVIHLNKIHLNHSQILAIVQCSNNPKPNLNPNFNPP